MRAQPGQPPLDVPSGQPEREWRILQTLRFRGPLPKAELSRITGINKQTVSTLVDKLLDGGWLVAQPPIYGKSGRPPMPVALSAGGASCLGARIGARGFELVTIDVLGRELSRERKRYDALEPDALQGDLRAQAGALAERARREGARLAGLGVSVPLWLGKGSGAARRLLGVSERWGVVEIEALLQGASTGPIEVVPEAVAACCAELVTGWGSEFRDFLYLYVGTFLGAGLVLEGRLYTGPGGRAGAIGLLGSGLEEQYGGDPPRLHEASGLHLRRALAEAGVTAEPERTAGATRPLDAPTRCWLESAATALARTCHFASCLLGLEGIVIDGSIPGQALQELVWRVEAELENRRWQGMRPPRVELGRAGPDARLLGAAFLPLYRMFMQQA